MATGSPTGPGRCPSEHAGGALLRERGGRKVGATAKARACPITPRPWFPPRSVPYLEGVPSHDRATSAGPRSFTDSLQLPGRPAGRRPSGPGVSREHPASCAVSPGNAGQPPSPAPPCLPACVFGTCPKALLPPLRVPRSPSLIQQLWTRCYHVGPGPPTMSHTVHVGQSPLGCTLSDLGMLSLDRWWVVSLTGIHSYPEVESRSLVNWLCSLGQVP